MNWGRVSAVRMRLWSLFCEGNKTSDVPQLTNNYLCSKALKQAAISPAKNQKSTAQHVEAKQRQNRVQDRYGTERGKKNEKKMLL